MKTAKLKTFLAFSLMAFCLAGECIAAPPNIELKIYMDKPVYTMQETIGLNVVAHNLGGDLLITEGFADRIFYLSMKMYDPSGRLVLVKRQEGGVNGELPDAPPMPWVMYNGALIQAVNCELLTAGWTNTDAQRVNDLRSYYDVMLPGYYSLQVEASAMTFTGNNISYCDINNYAWKGTLQSETVFFYLQGSTDNIQIVPDQWSTKWKSDQGKPEIIVHLPFAKEETAENYIANTITLGTVKATRIQTLKPKIVAYFDAKAALASLGSPQVGMTYTLYVSGLYSNNQRFFREVKIRIVN